MGVHCAFLYNADKRKVGFSEEGVFQFGEVERNLSVGGGQGTAAKAESNQKKRVV